MTALLLISPDRFYRCRSEDEFHPSTRIHGVTIQKTAKYTVNCCSNICSITNINLIFITSPPPTRCAFHFVITKGSTLWFRTEDTTGTCVITCCRNVTKLWEVSTMQPVVRGWTFMIGMPVIKWHSCHSSNEFWKFWVFDIQVNMDLSSSTNLILSTKGLK
jgi:hypothetical protein